MITILGWESWWLFTSTCGVNQGGSDGGGSYLMYSLMYEKSGDVMITYM